MATRTFREADQPTPDGERTHDLVAAFPTKYLPPVKIRELPPAPRSLWKIMGPGIIAAGVGLSILLIVLNRRMLPEPIKIGRGRIAALVWSTLLFGFLSVLTFSQYVERIATALGDA